MIRAAVALLALVLSDALPVQAGTELNSLARIEVLDGGRTREGTYQAALDLTLADGWKTYWRAPGDAGIPPQINWAGSRNVDSVTIIWPAPHVFDQSGLRSIGYTHRMVLPVEITPKRADRPVRLKGEIEFGICSDICIPAELSFDRALEDDAPRNPAIAAALAARPLSANEAGVRAATCSLTPVKDGIRLTARLTMPSAGGREFVVIEPGLPMVRASEAEVERRGGVLTATSVLAHAEALPWALERSAVRITVLGQRQAVDIRGCSAD